MLKPWRKLTSKELGYYKIFRLREDEYESPLDGAQHSFFVLEAPEWINVVPVTPAGEILMVRQFRFGTEEFTLEVPSGMVDPEDSEPGHTAARELREETGYVAEAMIKLGRAAANPAFLNNHCHTYLAQNVRLVGAQQLDGTEQIAIELVPLAEVHQLIQTGAISHSLTIMAMYWYGQYLARQAES